MPKNNANKTARDMNRAAGEKIKILRVPLLDARQMFYLRKLAEFEHLGQTPEEVAAFFITEGILKCQSSKGLHIQPPKGWKGFKP